MSMQDKIKIGDIIKCVNASRLKGNNYRPEVVDEADYELVGIATCPICGQEHYDIGLISKLNFISCYTCKQAGKQTIIEGSKEIGSIHYCHPIRFIKA